MATLRIIFMGTAPLARTILETLVQRPDFEIVSVVTQPDRPKGRDLKPQAPAVKEAALQRSLPAPVLQPERARNPEFIEQLRQLQPDLMVVAAYGQILPQAILDLARFGCLNVHTSLLPKYRGAAPIQWAILEDEPETGVTIMKMDAGLDTGDIVSEQRTPIRPEDNAQTLHDRLAQLGGDLLVRTIPDYVTGRIVPRPQPSSGASYARKITKKDGLVDWKLPARAIWNRVRAFVPWPGAYTHLPGPKPLMLKIWEAEIVERRGQPGEILSAGKDGLVIACGRDALRISNLQLEGKRRMMAQEFLAGHVIENTKLR